MGRGAANRSILALAPLPELTALPHTLTIDLLTKSTGGVNRTATVARLFDDAVVVHTSHNSTLCLFTSVSDDYMCRTHWINCDVHLQLRDVGVFPTKVKTLVGWLSLLQLDPSDLNLLRETGVHLSPYDVRFTEVFLYVATIRAHMSEKTLTLSLGGGRSERPLYSSKPFDCALCGSITCEHMELRNFATTLFSYPPKF